MFGFQDVGFHGLRQGFEVKGFRIGGFSFDLAYGISLSHPSIATSTVPKP